MFVLYPSDPHRQVPIQQAGCKSRLHGNLLYRKPGIVLPPDNQYLHPNVPATLYRISASEANNTR